MRLDQKKIHSFIQFAIQYLKLENCSIETHVLKGESEKDFCYMEYYPKDSPKFGNYDLSYTTKVCPEMIEQVKHSHLGNWSTLLESNTILQLSEQDLYILDGIAHEMIHIDQVNRGDLEMYVREDGQVAKKWKGIAQFSTVAYKDRQWEKEAFKRSSEVVKAYALFIQNSKNSTHSA